MTLTGHRSTVDLLLTRGANLDIRTGAEVKEHCRVMIEARKPKKLTYRIVVGPPGEL